MATAFADRRDEAAADELLRRYYAPAWHFAADLLGDREEALDVVQEAFVRVVRRIDQYDRTRTFAPWFYGILRHACVDHLRRRHRRLRLLTEFAAAREMEDGGGGCTRAASPAWGGADLWGLLDSLSAADRLVLICRHLHGMTVAETAEVLGIAEEAANKRAQRALAKLRQTMLRHDGPGAADRVSGPGGGA